jgi:hypothetical protein
MSGALSGTAAMDSVAAKAGRVLGAFSILIGASLALDAQAWRVGGLLAAAGASSMLWGLLAAATRRRVPESESPHEDPVGGERP